MGCIIYTAKNRGRMQAAHSEGTEYVIECNFNVANQSDERVETTVRSMAGSVFTQLVRTDSTLELSTTWVDNDARLELLEFLGSVAGGESFTVDPDGTFLTPVETFTGTIEGDYKITRHGTLPLYRVSFTVSFDPSDTVLG
jgi:hypothetical protein